MSRDGSEILVDRENNLNPRKLTPRECARLQGFPDDFIIKVLDVQAYKQFGNSVPVAVINKVARSMFNSILSLRMDHVKKKLVTPYKNSYNITNV